MSGENYVAASEFCSVHNLDPSFIRSLAEYGLIDTIDFDNSQFLKQSQLPKLKQIARLHHELDINMEGIYAIMNLMQRIRVLQTEMDSFKKKSQV
ncbi:MAG: MerR family transcriptional regulator [Bacteroidetes bacterium]|nr:MAG: MerR family transcriptional regulator [Bacteroidota bacterium]